MLCAFIVGFDCVFKEKKDFVFVQSDIRQKLAPNIPHKISDF